MGIKICSNCGFKAEESQWGKTLDAVTKLPVCPRCNPAVAKAFRERLISNGMRAKVGGGYA